MNAFEQGLRRYLSENVIRALGRVKVGIGGAGGLGSNIAVILVRSGFRDIEIVDEDRIEPSNLNRQQYFLAEIGQPKVKILKERLLSINPDIRVVARRERWRPENGERYFRGADVVVEAFDKAEGKFRFVEYYRGRTGLVVSGNGMAGLKDKQPMVTKRLGNVIIVGDNATDTRAGHPPLAPRVTACAAMMAEAVMDAFS